MKQLIDEKILMAKYGHILTTVSLTDFLKQFPPEFSLQVMDAVLEYEKQFKEGLKTDNNPVAMMQEIFMAMDQMSAGSFEHDKKISCKKGCAFCCNIEVSITEYEALAIWDYVKFKKMQPPNIAYLERQTELNENTWPHSPHSSCVFLGAENECTIYAARPMACRKYYVVSDPQLCNAHTNQKGEIMKKIDHNIEILASAVSTTATRKNSGNMPTMLLKTKPQ